VFFSGLFYTMDVEMMAIISVIAGMDSTLMSFFMYCMFQWAFGPWELVIMTVFLCFAVEPAFRIGHEFVFPMKAEPPAGGAGGDPQLALPPPPDGGDQDEGGILPENFGEEMSDGSPAGASPAECLQRSVYMLIGTVLTISVKLSLCGIVMLACQFRLFTRMGAVAIVGSMIWAPSALIIMPAAILFSGRERREPDLYVAWRWLKEKANANWS
jgi:hypothetical protein